MRFAPCLTAGLLCLMTLACQGADDLKSAQQAYHDAGMAVVEMVNAKKIDAAQVAAKVLVMERNAAILGQAYAAKYPAGKKLLETVIAKVVVSDAQGQVTGLGSMQELSFEEIEQQWHDGGYFKANDLGVNFEEEENEHFTDPIHSMVHPMMVLRAAIDYQTSQDAKALKAMKEEMDEGLEQIAKTLETITK